MTSKGPWFKHEEYYYAKTDDEVPEVVAKSLMCHPMSCPSLDKVTDPTDEVVVTACTEVEE